MIGNRERRTKKKEIVFIFRNIERFDDPPLPISIIDNIEIVPGTRMKY